MIHQITNTPNQKACRQGQGPISLVCPGLALVIFATLFFGLGACNQNQAGKRGSDSQLVDIRISSGGEALGGRPLVYLHEGGTKICRRGLPDPKVYGLTHKNCGIEEEEEEETASDTGTTTTTTDTETTTTTEEEEEDNEIPHTVGKNWFETGLFIVNKSTTEWLIIESISFTIYGTWGNTALQGQKELSSGYCGTTPLYKIPPSPKGSSANSTQVRRDLLYQPNQSDVLNNLKLYIDGVPIPTAPPETRDAEGGGGGEQARSPGDQGTAGGNQVEPEPELFVLDRLPHYRVQALARGYWINEKCETMHNFEKKFRFSLSSSFQN